MTQLRCRHCGRTRTAPAACSCDPLAESIPAHQVAMAISTALAALSEVQIALDECADRHGVRAVERITGLSRQTVSRWRHGDIPGRDTLKAVSDALSAAGCA